MWKGDLTQEYDISVMEKICQDTKPVNILERLNDVRLFLKVSCLSNIAITASSEIENWTLYGLLSATRVTWPERQMPLEENMNLWRDTLMACFFVYIGYTRTI